MLSQRSEGDHTRTRLGCSLVVKMLGPFATYTMSLVDVSGVYKHVHVPVMSSVLVLVPRFDFAIYDDGQDQCLSSFNL